MVVVLLEPSQSEEGRRKRGGRFSLARALVLERCRNAVMLLMVLVATQKPTVGKAGWPLANSASTFLLSRNVIGSMAGESRIAQA